jgi:hypothetical protein
MKGTGSIVVAAAIIAGAFIVSRRRRRAASGAAADRFQRINDLIPTPQQVAAHWAAASNPNQPQTGQTAAGQGTVQPGSLAGNLASMRNFGCVRRVWVNPRAGTTRVRTKPSDPAGLQVFGAPSTPSTYTPQSQVRPQSLYLYPGMRIDAPLSFSTQFQGLSWLDPYAELAPGAGGYVDITHKAPTAATSRRWTNEHA